MTRKTARTKKPITEPVFVRFPSHVLPYLSVAVDGPPGPGALGHRAVWYPATVVGRHGHRYATKLVGAACQPTTTQPGPRHDDDPDDIETVPVTVLADYSASYAQHRGVTRCTADACFPPGPDETTPGGTR